MILFTIYDLFTMNVYDGEGRKTPKYIKRKPRKKYPVWLPSQPPVYENGGRLFSGVRKQAGPTLGGTGGPSLVGQRNIGFGTVVGS